MKKRVLVICALALVVVVLGVVVLLPHLATPAPYTRYSRSFFNTFDTVVTVIAYAQSEEDFNTHYDVLIKMFEHDHQLFDQYHAYEGVENIYSLNLKAAQAPVKVDQELFDLLKFVKDKQLSEPDTTVNIAMGTVLGLWHTYREDAETSTAKLPPMEQLERLSAHTDVNCLILDAENCTVFYSDPYLKLDLGAVAKGYATERAAQYLLTTPLKSFIISAGGNVRTGNAPMDERDRWGVGIQDPDENAFGVSQSMETLYLTDLSIVTSGDYQRYYTVDGVRYHHLISPRTLMPANHFRSVTIITKDSALADYLSTDIFLRPYEEGRALVDQMAGVEAMWVLNDRTVVMTDGMAVYARSMGATSTD